ncbi:MAG TPA: hypothetical protein VED63_04975 [Acidimicrobiales bacterium]|nr:hypothetical protein [Acidimicrobiales bacterium]
MERACQLADSHLEGINEAAEELAAMSGVDLAVISKARRMALERMSACPDHAAKQVVWLIRRAIEVGGWRWQWEDDGSGP